LFSKKSLLYILVTFLVVASKGWAQTGGFDDGSDDVSAARAAEVDVDQVEAELNQNLAKQKAADQGDSSLKEEKIETFSDLGRLAPFSEVSVIQKRYLPKTGRFQAFGGLTYSMNDPWFLGLGLSGKIGYFLTEAWGIELSYTTLSNIEKSAVQDLKNNHAVTTTSLVSPKSYIGADVVWTPVYGKMSVGNKKILPFDMYFSLGAGNTGTADSQSAGTLRLSTGQIFAISKGMGFRWDFGWNRYNATTIDGTTGTFDNLLLTLGMSFFFPEAKYR
jgi:outer membrane beta-barrel protein